MDSQERDELKAVLQSDVFVRAPRQAKLLRYICNEYFEGRGSNVKEYNLASEVFGRAVEFDQSKDPIVRVEAHRLRQKLKVYYKGEGAGHPLRIVLDPGSYAPRFIPADGVASLESPGNAAFSQPTENLDAESPIQLLRGIAARIRAMSGFRVLPVALGGLAVIILAALIMTQGWRFPWSRVKTSPGAGGISSPGITVAAGALDSVRILCGYGKDLYVDRDGNRWQGDRYYSGGEPASQPPSFIARAAEINLFRSSRTGEFSYDIPLNPGNYELHLYFAETHLGPGTLVGGGESGRIFNVWMNGKMLLEMFDIITDAGGSNIADVRVFKDVTPAPDGRLHLKFEASNYRCILNALEIEPAPPGKINPIRITTRENSYTDSSGNIWRSDRYYSGGQQAMHITRLPVSNTSDPDLYSSERFGNFNYALPVAPGKYALTLRFAETYWGAETYLPGVPDEAGSPTGGVGNRVFDVYCNGVALLRNFDIVKEAGGPLRAVDRTFHNLQPNAQGKIILAFVPIHNYAKVTAIELVSEPD